MSQDKEHDGMVIDTSAMNDGKASALEVAEAARQDNWTQPSFAKALFQGEYLDNLILPFPLQDEADRKKGDAFIAELITFLKENLNPDEVDETRTIPQHVIDGLAKMGAFAMKIPEAYGGLGFSQINYNRSMMALASHCGSTAVLLSAHQSIGVPQPLKLFGTEEQKRKFLPAFREGAISAFALTEPNVGSDPGQMETTAVLSEDGTEYLINGEKLWCTNGLIADFLVVMAVSGEVEKRGRKVKQISAFIVDCKSDGIEKVHRCDFMGIRAIQNGLIRFKDLRVPVENRVGEEGQGLKLALATLNTGRLTLPAACTGMSKQCLSMARLWAKERVQWGSPIGEHEAGSNRLAFIASSTYAMEAVTLLTSHMADDKKLDIRIEAAMAKLFCSELAWTVVDETVQLLGGRGYERASSLKGRGEPPFAAERMLRDCRINRIIEGTTDIMHLFLAREALDLHLQLAADLIHPKSSLTKRLKGLWKCMKHYSIWYPQQYINRSWVGHRDAAGPLGAHMDRAEKESHRLARTLFHAMGRHREKLEERQEILAHLMEIGTELFAITATCSFAMTQKEASRDGTALAQHFCHLAWRRIHQHYLALSNPDAPSAKGIRQRILAGQLTWLEEGVVPWQ